MSMSDRRFHRSGCYNSWVSTGCLGNWKNAETEDKHQYIIHLLFITFYCFNEAEMYLLVYYKPPSNNLNKSGSRYQYNVYKWQIAENDVKRQYTTGTRGM